jgi:hypothetical protein
VTSGSETNQTTGAWTGEATSSVGICGALKARSLEQMKDIAGGKFKVGEQIFQCHSDCDVELNDLLEVFEDAGGSTKTYWRVVSKIQKLQMVKNLLGYGRNYYTVIMENR